MRAVAMVVLAGCGRLDFAPSAIDANGDCVRVGVADNFDDGVTGPQWTSYAVAPAAIAEVGGVVSITLAPNVTGNHYAGYLSMLLDVRDHCESIELVAVPNSSGPVEIAFTVTTSTTMTTGLVVGGGNLEAFTRFGATYTALSTVPFDPVAHQFVRIRESGGTTFWETSPDGASFTPQASGPTPFDFSAVDIEFDAGTYGVIANPGPAAFDDFDLP